MSTKHASREAIFSAAEQIHKSGRNPTTIAIRQTLGVGSQTTIHKYLTEWKKIQDNKDNVHIKRAQVKINEYETVNHDLSEKINLAYEQLNAQAKIIDHLQEQNLNLETTNYAYKSLVESFKDEFNRKIDEMESNFSQAINILAEQLNNVVNGSLESVQQAGFAFQEKVIQERLRVKELEAQLKEKAYE